MPTSSLLLLATDNWLLPLLWLLFFNTQDSILPWPCLLLLSPQY